MGNSYDYGDLIRCTGTFTDSDGNAQDPAVVKFTFIDPGGTSTTYIYSTDPELVKDSTGVYHVDVDADEVGQFHYRFYSTGAGQAADEGWFRVEDSEFD